MFVATVVVGKEGSSVEVLASELEVVAGTAIELVEDDAEEVKVEELLDAEVPVKSLLPELKMFLM